GIGQNGIGMHTVLAKTQIVGAAMIVQCAFPSVFVEAVGIDMDVGGTGQRRDTGITVLKTIIQLTEDLRRVGMVVGMGAVTIVAIAYGPVAFNIVPGIGGTGIEAERPPVVAGVEPRR